MRDVTMLTDTPANWFFLISGVLAWFYICHKAGLLIAKITWPFVCNKVKSISHKMSKTINDKNTKL